MNPDKAVSCHEIQMAERLRELDEEIAYLEWSLNKTKLELARWEEGDLIKVRLTNESKGAHVEEAIQKIESDLKFREERRHHLWF